MKALKKNLTLACIVLLGMSLGSIPSQAQTFAYVTNQGISGDVSVIATASNTVVATVPVGNNKNLLLQLIQKDQ